MTMETEALIREIAEVQKDYEALGEVLEELKARRNSMIRDLFSRTQTEKADGAGIKIITTRSVRLNGDYGEINARRWQKITQLRAELKGLEDAAKEEALLKGEGCTVSESYRVIAKD